MKGHYGAGKLRSAPPGTGIIAGGPMRAVFETLAFKMLLQNLLSTPNLILSSSLLKLFHL